MTVELLLLWCIAGLAGFLVAGRNEGGAAPLDAALAAAIGPFAFLVAQRRKPQPIPIKVPARGSRRPL